MKQRQKLNHLLLYTTAFSQVQFYSFTPDSTTSLPQMAQRDGGCGHNSSSLLLLPCTRFSCYSVGPFYGLQGTTPVWSLCAQAPRSPPALLLLSTCCLCGAAPHTAPLTAPCYVVFAATEVRRCHLCCRAWPCPAVGPLQPAVGRAGQLQHHFTQQLCSAPDAKTLTHAFSTP